MDAVRATARPEAQARQSQPAALDYEADACGVAPMHARIQDQKAANVGEQPQSLTGLSPREVAANLTGREMAANSRLADALVKTNDFSGVMPSIQDALRTGGKKALAEVTDLIQQMDGRKPGHGQKLGQKLAEAVNVFARPTMDEHGNWFDQHGNRIANPDGGNSLVHVKNSGGNTGQPVPMAQSQPQAKYAPPVPNSKMRNDMKGAGHFGASRGGRNHRGG